MRKIMLFGYGKYFHKKIKSLMKKYTIIAILDNSAPDNKQYKGIPIISPQNISDYSLIPIMILAYRETFIEIVKQLLELGIPSKNILLGINEDPCFDAGEALLHKIDAKVAVSESNLLLKYKTEEFYFSNIFEYKCILRNLRYRSDALTRSLIGMKSIKNMNNFGIEFGKPIDRYYIEQFLKQNVSLIRGNVLEVGDNTYTYKFGNNINKAIAIHLTKKGDNIINTDLSKGQWLSENMFDCFICTQTIQMIYDIQKVPANIYKLLKPGGAALITTHGISKISTFDYNLWGEYWHLTAKSLQYLFSDVFGEENVFVFSFGNVKTACCFLYGLNEEDLNESDFQYNDTQFPVILAAVCKKIV